MNANLYMIRGVVTPVGASKYMPHIGAKESRRHAGKLSLGPNASRALRQCQPAVEKSESSFQVGTTVTWTSSNLEKMGEIVAIVPAGEHPSADLTPKVKDPGAPRDHESYVVRANGKHYWPRVSLLSIAN